MADFGFHQLLGRCKRFFSRNMFHVHAKKIWWSFFGRLTWGVQNRSKVQSFIWFARNPRILVSYDPFQAGNSLVGSPSMNPKTMNPQTTNPSTNRQTKTRAKPSCFNPCQGRFGHPRHNVSTAFFFMERLVFPVWTCRWHFYWRPNQNVTSAFHPQKTKPSVFWRKKNIPTDDL